MCLDNLQADRGVSEGYCYDFEDDIVLRAYRGDILSYDAHHLLDEFLKLVRCIFKVDEKDAEDVCDQLIRKMKEIGEDFIYNHMIEQKTDIFKKRILEKRIADDRNRSRIMMKEEEHRRLYVYEKEVKENE